MFSFAPKGSPRRSDKKLLVHASGSAYARADRAKNRAKQRSRRLDLVISAAPIITLIIQTLIVLVAIIASPKAAV